MLGIGVVTAFVFWGSESTIDAPRISGIDTGEPASGGQGAHNPVVRVIGGAPPKSGPVTLRFRQGQEVRIEFDSDSATGIEVPGYGISETIDAGRSSVSFAGRKAGRFPVIATASHIGVATLRISRGS